MEFPQDEYQLRIRRAKDLMRQFGFDALMVTGDFCASPNYRYLSGHLPRDFQFNFGKTHVMILTRNGEAALVVYHLNKQNAIEGSWVTSVHDYAQPFSGRVVADAAHELGLDRATIGMELGRDQRLMMPVAEFEVLKDGLPRAEFADASELLWELRMIKSPAEIEFIREADRINGRALEKALTSLQVGVTEVEIAKTVGATIVREGAFRPPYAQINITSSPKYMKLGHRSRFLGPAPEPLGEGDIIFVDSGCVVNGYWGEFNRMAILGEPSDDQEKAHETVRTIVQTTIDEAIKPGATGKEVMEFIVSLYERLGLEERQYAKYMTYPYSHLCHGIGLSSSEPPLVRIDNEQPLRRGMVLSVEAYIQADVTYGTEEDVYISETGCELLSPQPDRGLYVNPV